MLGRRQTPLSQVAGGRHTMPLAASPHAAPSAAGLAQTPVGKPGQGPRFAHKVRTLFRIPQALPPDATSNGSQRCVPGLQPTLLKMSQALSESAQEPPAPTFGRQVPAMSLVQYRSARQGWLKSQAIDCNAGITQILLAHTRD